MEAPPNVVILSMCEFWSLALSEFSETQWKCWFLNGVMSWNRFLSIQQRDHTVYSNKKLFFNVLSPGYKAITSWGPGVRGKVGLYCFFSVMFKVNHKTRCYDLLQGFVISCSHTAKHVKVIRPDMMRFIHAGCAHECWWFRRCCKKDISSYYY